MARPSYGLMMSLLLYYVLLQLPELTFMNACRINNYKSQLELVFSYVQNVTRFSIKNPRPRFEKILYLPLLVAPLSMWMLVTTFESVD